MIKKMQQIVMGELEDIRKIKIQLDEETKGEPDEVPIQTRETEAMKDTIYFEVKHKLEKIMNYEDSDKPISVLLTETLNEAEVFDKEKHYELFNLLIKTLRELAKHETSFCSANTEIVLREVISDFLFRFKDKHPFSNPIEGEIMDVFDTVMETMSELGIQPSKSLYKEYSLSKITRRLNILPTREYLNQKFHKNWQISEEKYELLKKRYYSRPPFVYLFNPNIQLQEQVNSYGWLMIGFFKKGSETRIGAGMVVYNNGSMYQGYHKDSYVHNYVRWIEENGDIYEGEFNMSKKHGKGEVEYYEDGRKEIGYWVKCKKEGEFDCIYKDGTVVKKNYLDDKEVKAKSWYNFF